MSWLCCLPTPTLALPSPLHLPPAAFAPCPQHSLGICLLFVQLWGVTDLHLSRRSITKPPLIYTTAVHGRATSRTPLGWAACTHTHVHRKWGCGMPAAPTDCLSCEGEGNSAVKSWRMHFFPKWHHAPRFCRQSKRRHCHLLVGHIGVGAADLGNWFCGAMDNITPDQGLDLSRRPLEVPLQPHCWWEVLNSPRHTQLFWTQIFSVPRCSCQPTQPVLIVVNRGRRSSAILIMKDRVERRGTEKRHVHICILKSNLCFYCYHAKVYMLKTHASSLTPIPSWICMHKCPHIPG